jgi:hypothetical protein
VPRADDHSTGDARQPYSDQGGPAGRHAQTHDVRLEEATRSKPHDDGEDFEADLKAEQTHGGHVDESILASDDKELKTELDLSADELKRLSLLTVGTRLDQGGTYVDLNDPVLKPFRAMGGQEAGEDNRYVAKRDTDYDLWDHLVGQGRSSEVRRPVEQD